MGGPQARSTILKKTNGPPGDRGTKPPASEATAAASTSITKLSSSRPLASEFDAIARAEHADPFRVLGPHVVESSGHKHIIVRAFRPDATAIEVVLASGEATYKAARVHASGIFEAILPLSDALLTKPASYRLRIQFGDAAPFETADPYAFPPQLSDFDLYLIGEGTHYQKYEKLGAHVREIAGVQGTHFGVWAPNARRVSVVGDFNRWDGRVHPMRNRGATGVWEIFVPGVAEAMIYKFEILPSSGGPPLLKADPYAFQSELRPKSGSIVASLDGYSWGDSAWLAARGRRNWLEAPIAIYEVHLGSWRREGNRWLTYRELADRLVPYVKENGFTHIELLPIMEHPFDASWGYQTTGYFAATSRHGSPADLMHFVDRCHQEGIGVLLDWTPAHFPRDSHGLATFDGTHLYEHADPRMGEHPDWGTLVFNYGRNEVQNFLISNALFWLDRYHMDGLRVDAVASMLYLDYSRKSGEWVPNEFGGRENLAAIAFLKRMNEVVHSRHAGVLTIAEESTAWPAVSRPTYVGGLGFSLKWNMGWMNDTLKYFHEDPIHRKFHHGQITFSMLYAFTENFVLPLSHDEVVHGKGSLLSKMPGDSWQQFANLRLLFGYMCGHPGKKLLFMGGELAQRAEWNQDGQLDWGLLKYESHNGVHKLVDDLNRLYAAEASLHEVDFDWPGFAWIDCNDADASVLSFIRRAKNPDDFLIVVANFTPVLRENYRVGVPEQGFYREILNTDSATFGGSNAGNLGGAQADHIPWLQHRWSLNLRLPPLGVIFLKLRRA